MARGPGNRRAPTINDVAAAAGVGRGTVSRVLNGGRWVSPATAAAVEKAMADTGYVANASARGLASGRSGAIALVVTEPPERLFEDPTFAALVRGVTAAVAEHNLTLFLTLAHDPASRAGLLRQVRSGALDGIALVSTHGDDPLFAALIEGDLAAVVCSRPLGAGAALPYVCVADEHGAEEMTRHLLDRGRRRIGLITGPPDTAGALNRLAGYATALGDRLDRALVRQAPEYSYRAGAQAMAGLLTAVEDLDAVFAASDILAAGALSVLDAAGIAVPEQVALGSFDDSTLARSSKPALTTVRLPFDEIARTLVDLLVARMKGEHPAPVELPTELVVRDST